MQKSAKVIPRKLDRAELLPLRGILLQIFDLYLLAYKATHTFALQK